MKTAPADPTPHCHRNRRIAGLVGMGVLASLLQGCGAAPADQRVEALEQRVIAVEARAEAAEKRAKAAEDIARHAAPNPYVSNDAFPEQPFDPDVNIVTDPSTEDPQFNNSPAPPPAPVIPSEG